MAEFSNSQIDRLGDRLKEGSHSESDLRMLDEYRRSFSEAYELVLQTIRRHYRFPTSRTKTNLSIVSKLRRESMRLSRMQDIAGCRIIVADILAQDEMVAALQTDFPEARVMDRRNKPSHGYRAVHVIATILGKPVEIQIRTSLQDLWAQFSEKASDVLDPAIKYGGGPDDWREILATCSRLIKEEEDDEDRLARNQEQKKAAVDSLAKSYTTEERRDALKAIEEASKLVMDAAIHSRDAALNGLRHLISELERLEGKGPWSS